jgi:hypothetical protein
MRVATRSAFADVSFGAFGLALLALAAAFSVFGIPPLPPALIVALGVPSPLTGMTRSFVAMASGDIARAFWFHPLGPLTFVVCAIAATSAAMTLRTGRRPLVVDRLASSRMTWIVVAVAFAAVWVRQMLVF